MSVVPKNQFDFVQAQLEDTQQSLAAAIARIEIFRQREKLLLSDIAKLQLGGNSEQQEAAAQPEQTKQPAESSKEDSRPCYITEVEGHLPVMIISSSGRKSPGSIVVTQDYIDFVEVRARIKRHDFVGFTSAPAAAAAAAGTEQPHSPSAAARHSRQLEADAAADGRHPAAAAAAASGASDGGSGGGSQHPADVQLPGTAAAAELGSSRDADGHGGHGGSGFSSSSSSSSTGAWQILWRGGGRQQRLAFEATHQTRELLHRHTSSWLGGTCDDTADPASGVALAAAGARSSDAVELSVPRLLVPGPHTPLLSEPSSILLTSSAVGGTEAAAGLKLADGLQHLAAALPARFQGRPWSLLYSTARHGISLTTLYRKAAGSSPSLLLVRDTGGYVFGAFATEPWRPSARFFGTGEMFVFQLAPHKVMYPWKVKSSLKNDFFMYAQPDAMAVGGLGAFAIWLDAELLQGSSGSCGTFGSPCLSSKEEFKVAALELWAI